MLIFLPAPPIHVSVLEQYVQVFVETLDRCFENVCELDLIFHSDRVHYVLDEIIMGGMVLETQSQEVLEAVEGRWHVLLVAVAPFPPLHTPPAFAISFPLCSVWMKRACHAWLGRKCNTCY